MGTPQSHAHKEHSTPQQWGILHVGPENNPESEQPAQAYGKLGRGSSAALAGPNSHPSL